MTNEFSPLAVPLFDKACYCGILLTPRKMFYEWARYIIPETEYFNMQGGEFFLLPDFNSNEHAEEFCRLFFDLFFQYMLGKCISDPALWPVNRTYEMFHQWFEVRITRRITSIQGPLYSR